MISIDSRVLGVYADSTMRIKTKADLENLVKGVGGTLEEDTGNRELRVFQLVAPEGTRWVEGHTQLIRVEWARGSSLSAIQFNADEYRIAAERVCCLLEKIPAADAWMYAED